MTVTRYKWTVDRDPAAADYQTEWTLKTGTVSPLSFPDLAVEVERLFS